MVHRRGLASLLLSAALALAMAVAAAAVPLADDQPAAAQRQMVRFVSHFVAFTPKDPSILDNPDRRWFPGPSWLRAPARVRTQQGYMLLKPLAEIAPDLGPLDALTGRDPRAVAELLTRLDGNWDYHVLVLSASGPIGDMLVAAGTVGPVPLKTPEGLEVGQFDTARFDVFRVVRVERLVGDGNALWQATALVDQAGFSLSNLLGGGFSEVGLGAPTVQEADGVMMRPYTSAIGVAYPRVVFPGLVCLETVAPGAWDRQEPPLYY